MMNNKMNERNYLKKQDRREIVSKRSQCTKVFENADHTLTAAIYGQPVHFMEDGQWKAYDNRLTECGSEGLLENKASDMKVQFAAEAKAGETVRVRNDRGRLSWGPAASSTAEHAALRQTVQAQAQKEMSEGQTAFADGAEQAVSQAVSADGGQAVSQTVVTDSMEILKAAVTASVCYPEVWPGTDLRYTLTGGEVKEDILLQAVPETGVFHFIYRSPDLTAGEDGRGGICFTGGHGEAFTMTAPCMKDASGAVTNGVVLRLTESRNIPTYGMASEDTAFSADGRGVLADDGSVLADSLTAHEMVIAVEADMDWLKSPERVYPVIIDPVIKTSTSIYDIHDVHVSSWYNTDNFVNSIILKTGYIDGSTLRSYLKFTLPEISPADMVVAAYFRIANNSTSSTERRIDIHKVTKDWDHNTINWNNKPAYDTRVIDYCTFTNSKQEYRYFNITNLVKDWYLNDDNCGLLMKDSEEKGNYTEYLSSDCHDDYASIRPCIEIHYVNNTGLEDYWTYHSHSVGRAGTGYVNDYNGNQIFIHPTLTMTGNRMPVALSHVFNSNDRGTDIGYGLGFRLNYHQTIGSKTIGGTQYYKQVDGDGTIHYFVYDTEAKKWKDEENGERVLTIDSGSTAARYTISDKEDNRLIFNSGGLLVKVMDANGNALSITYGSQKITKLTDGSGRAVTLAYGTDGRLASVKDPAGRVKQFAYTGGRLTSITDVDGAVCKFTYDTADGRGMMRSAADPYGYKITYSYYDKEPYRMKQISETAGSTAGQSLTMAYGYNRTTFTDHKGRLESYLFDNAGRTVSVRNNEGYAAAWQYLDSGSHANQLSAASALQYVPVQLLKGITGGLTGWTKYSSDPATVTVAEDSTQGYLGGRSVRISSTALTGHGAVIQRVTLTPGKQYVFSAYAKASATEQAGNACLWLQIQDSNIKALKNSVLVKPAFSGWQRLQVAFTAPASDSGSVTVRILARMRYMKGDAWFDGFQLEEGYAASRLNLVENNAFTNGLTGYSKIAFTAADQVVHTGDVAQTQTVLTATVNDDKVYLRKGAGTEFASLAMASKNTKATVYGADYDKDGVIWYFIGITIGGKAYTGYMTSQYLTLSVPGASVAVSAIAGGNDLNIRSGAGTGYSSKVQVSRGTKMSVNGAAKDSGGVK